MFNSQYQTQPCPHHKKTILDEKKIEQLIKKRKNYLNEGLIRVKQLLSYLRNLKNDQVQELSLNDYDGKAQIFNTIDLSKWKKLRKLSVTQKKIDDDVLVLIFNKFGSYLQSMLFVECGFTYKTKKNNQQNDIKVQGLQKPSLNIPYFNIKQLDLRTCGRIVEFNNLGSRGIKTLTKIYLPYLKKLDLTHCGIGISGFRHMTKAYWKDLQELFLVPDAIELRAQRKSYFKHLNAEQSFQGLKKPLQFIVTVSSTIFALRIFIIENLKNCKVYVSLFDNIFISHIEITEKTIISELFKNSFQRMI